MNEEGLALLRRIEAMAEEIIAEQKRYRDVTEELTALKAEKAANLANGRERTAKSRAKKRDGNVTLAGIRSRSLLVEKKKELKGSPLAVTVTLPDHPALIAHFEDAVQRATGVKYEFGAEDGRHAKTLLQRYGLDEAMRLIDLAAARFQREAFYRGQGLTLRLVANDANKLRTANGRPTPVGSLPLWKRQGFESQAAYDEHLANLDGPREAKA